MSNDVDRYNATRVQPKSHAFIPREKGGTYGRCCVFTDTHPVHSTTPASNVVLLGGGRRAKR